MPTGLGLALMQLAGACSYLSDCMSLSAHSGLLLVSAWSGRADRTRPSCCYAPFACTACTTSREELMT